MRWWAPRTGETFRRDWIRKNRWWAELRIMSGKRKPQKGREFRVTECGDKGED